MISKEEVKHVAHLARLGLGDKEIEEIEEDLSSILEYIEKLKEVDISGAEIYSSFNNLENVARDDKVEKKLDQENRKLRELMPREKNRYLKVKKVFK